MLGVLHIRVRSGLYRAAQAVTSRPQNVAMARRGISDADQHRQAVQAARRMISQGDRPGYRLTIDPAPAGVSWSLVGLPGVTGTAPSHRDAPDVARAAISEVLDVPLDSFDVER